ncbi:MAG TPA: sugar phosphate isomerase/epimerase family protein [Methanomicrobiales archaeon]|jgi:sugar phosphate isomerase/epimerase|nr:sugar phosphate isomerase/epimerase family protein [Methanomicrobiales archaeon]
MSLTPYFSASSKVWEDRRWVYSLPEIGYEGWEVMADGRSTLEKRENVQEVAEIAASTHLALSIHAPYSDLNLASLNYPIWRESVRQVLACIDGASDLADRVTVHPGYLSPMGKLLPDKVWNLQKSALTEIGRYAGDRGVRVFLENMGGPKEVLCRFPGEVLGMIEGVENIGFTLDVGHAHTVGKVREFLRILPQVNHMHIHDNQGTADQHLAVGDGTIPWDEVGRAVAREYRGIVVVEGRSLEEAKKSLAVFRRCFV